MVYELTERAEGVARTFDRCFAVVTAATMTTSASATLNTIKMIRRVTASHPASRLEDCFGCARFEPLERPCITSAPLAELDESGCERK